MFQGGGKRLDPQICAGHEPKTNPKRFLKTVNDRGF
jgi:hypothetical protein